MSGKFKVGDWVIATTAAAQRYSITTPGSVGVVGEVNVDGVRHLMMVRFYYYTSLGGLGKPGYVYDVHEKCFERVNIDTLSGHVKAKIVQALFRERNGAGDEE